MYLKEKKTICNLLQLWLISIASSSLKYCMKEKISHANTRNKFTDMIYMTFLDIFGVWAYSRTKIILEQYNLPILTDGGILPDDSEMNDPRIMKTSEKYDRDMKLNLDGMVNLSLLVVHSFIYIVLTLRWSFKDSVIEISFAKCIVYLYDFAKHYLCIFWEIALWVSNLPKSIFELYLTLIFLLSGMFMHLNLYNQW